MKEGYKKTELGWIPEEWDVSNLSDIAEINPKKEVLYNEKEVSFIAMEHISNAGRVINKETRNYGEVSKGYTAFKDEDVLLAKITPCFENGKKAIVRNLKNGYGFGSTEFHVLRSKDERSIPEFLYYYVSTNKFRQQAELNMTGSAGQKRVPTIFLNDNKLVVPPLKEQQKIAEILSTVDSQIDDTDKLIEKTKELKKGLMQRLLTKGIGHKEFKMTEVGEIPVEWEVVDLGNVVEIVNGGTPSTSISEYWSEDEIPWVTPTDITSGSKYIKLTERYISSEGLKNSSATLLPVNSILMTSRATIGEKSINTIPMATNQGFKSLICSIKIDNEFLYYYLDILKPYFISKASGSTFLEISKKEVANTKVALPNAMEQKKIANILATVDTQIDEYENKKTKLEELKKGLMQQLLTGKVRVI